MNRRTFLASLAATSLTPIMPNQIFASGGIVNPEHCGYVAGEIACEGIITKVQAERIAKVYTLGRSVLEFRDHDGDVWKSIDVIFENGDGKPWRGGLIT